MDFAIDGEIELEFAEFDHKPVLEFTRMERHYNVTQAFFPLGNDASVTVFAPPTDPRDPLAVPKPADMRALYMDGAQGIMMWKGTWHTGRFPAQRSGARFTFLTEAATTADLPAVKEGKGSLSQIFDWQKTQGLTFRLTDPLGLMPK